MTARYSSLTAFQMLDVLCATTQKDKSRSWAGARCGSVAEVVATAPVVDQRARVEAN